MTGELDRILTIREPFGPRDTESVINLGLASADLLFDRSNLIYSQATSPSRPTYPGYPAETARCKRERMGG